MTITIKPEQAELIAEAIRAGLIESLEGALDIGVDTLRVRLKASAPPMDDDQWLRKFRAWAHSHSANTPLLSDEAISRESIYGDRGL